MNTNTNLSIAQAANDIAFQTINDSAIAVDKTCADRAAELQLNDPQYGQLKRGVAQFRQLYTAAIAQDKQAAQRAPVVAPKIVAPPTSSSAPQPESDSAAPESIIK